MDGELLADQPLGQKLIKKGFRAYFFTFMVAPIGYFIKLIVSNAVSVEDIGVFYSVLGFITLISLYNDLGLTEALQYFIPKYWIEKKYDYYKTIIYMTWIIQFITGITISCLLFFGSDWLALNHFHSQSSIPIIKILAFYFLGVNLCQVLSSIFYAFQDVKSNGLVEASRNYGILIFVIFLFFGSNLNLSTFSIAWLSGLGIAILVGVIIFFRKYGYTLKYGKVLIQKKLLKIQFNYAIRVFLAANVSTLLSQVDQQMVVNLLGVEQAGYYTIFSTLIGVYIAIIRPILGILFPVVTEFITKKDVHKLSIMQNILYKYFSVLALSVGAVFIVLGPQISYVLFGTKFIYSGILLSLSGIFLVFNTLFIINYQILAGLGKIKERIKILGRALLANVLINILLLYVLKVGLVGVIVALAVGRIILYWRSYLVVHRNINISFNWKYLLGNISVIGVLILVIFYIKDFIFIADDIFRYRNFLFLAVTILFFYLVLGLINYKSIRTLLNEIKGLRK